MRMGRPADLVLAPAKQLRVRLELNVTFQADNGLVVGGGKCGCGHNYRSDYQSVIPSLSMDNSPPSPFLSFYSLTTYCVDRKKILAKFCRKK